MHDGGAPHPQPARASAGGGRQQRQSSGAEPATASAAPGPQPTPCSPRSLPAWLDHFNGHDLKTFLRCWAAAWIAILLVFIGPVLRALGVATLFATLLLFIIPPAGIVFAYLLAGLSVLLGMCLAWAWGLLTMKAAMAARPEADTQARLQALQQQASAQANQTNQSVASEAQLLVYEGFMLDARVTVIYYVMACVFIYLLARLRCSNAKLVPFQLFGTIITDVVLLTGPLLPSFRPTLPTVLVKPGAVGIGIGMACCLIFFPQSTSYVVLGTMEKLVRMGETSFAATRNRLAGESVSLGQLKAARVGFISVYKAMEPALAFLPLDFSRGRWSADDAKALQEPIRVAMLANVSLLDLHMSRISAQEKEDRLGRLGDETASLEKDAHEPGHRQLQESADLLNAFKNPEEAVMQARAREALQQTTAEVLRLCSEATSLAADCIHAANSCRWFRVPSQATFEDLTRNLQQTLTTLESATEICAAKTTEAVIDSHAELFDDQGLIKSQASPHPNMLRGIVMSMVTEERILGAADATQKLLHHLLHLNASRTRHRLWFPSRLSYAFSWLFNGSLVVPAAGTAESAPDPDSQTEPAALEELAKEAQRRLRLSRGYHGSSARRSRLSRYLVATFHWLTNPAGMYALRMVVVTIALAIPSAIPHSAGFFYREKGIWGVISAQTCLLLYMADFTFSLVARVAGTIVGGVLGMVAWYIGSGNGPGNPYGLGAISAVMVAILMWWRLFLPPPLTLACMMTGMTFTLVVGFSWDENHIWQYGLPGVGYEAFYRRLVTVLLGFLAAFIVQLFPKPPSASSHVSKTLANTVRTLSDHYALLLSHWGRTDKNSPLRAVAENISLDIADRLMSLNATIPLLKSEMSFGPFDQEVLSAAKEQCQHMNQSLWRLLHLSTTLPRELQSRLAQVVGITDDRAIGDIMAVLNIIEQSLRTGNPLPERLPAPLVRRFFDSWYSQHRRVTFSTTLIRDENYRRYCVAMSSYLKFLSTIDDLVLVLKRSLGERHVIHHWEDV